MLIGSWVIAWNVWEWLTSLLPSLLVPHLPTDICRCPPLIRHRSSLLPGHPLCPYYLLLARSSLPVGLVWTAGVLERRRPLLSRGLQGGQSCVATVLPWCAALLRFCYWHRVSWEQETLTGCSSAACHGASTSAGLPQIIGPRFRLLHRLPEPAGGSWSGRGWLVH